MTRFALPEGLAELRDSPHWVNWNLETRPGDPKPTKIPYTPSLTGYAEKAKANDPTTWGDFATAAAAAEAGRFDGVGYEAVPGILLFDLDKVIDAAGKIAPVARAIMALANSYAEPSPSNTGIRILAKGQLPRPQIPEDRQGKKSGGFELYGGVHFGTLTFRPFRGYEQLREIDAETMVRLCALMWPGEATAQPKEPTRPLSPPPPLNLDDAELMEKAFGSKGGDDFYHLHHGTNGRTSASEDDFAYLGRLRFWAQGDPVRMRRIALTSGRVREKWHSRRGGSDWLDYSIAKVLSEPHDVYDPSRASGKRIAFTFPDDGDVQDVADIAEAVVERDRVIAHLEEENEGLHERLAACKRERERLAAENAALREEISARKAAAAHTDQTIGGAIFDIAGEIVAARQRGDVLNEDGKQFVRVEYKRASTHGIRSAQTNSKAVHKLKDSGHVPVTLRPVRIETENFVGEVEAAYIEIPEEHCETPAKAALYLLPPPAPKKHGGARRKLELPDFGEEVEGPIEVKTEKKRIYRAVATDKVLHVTPLESHTEYCDPLGYQMTAAEVEDFEASIGKKIRRPAYHPEARVRQVALSEDDAELFKREPVDLDDPAFARVIPIRGGKRCVCGNEADESGWCWLHRGYATMAGAGA